MQTFTYTFDQFAEGGEVVGGDMGWLFVRQFDEDGAVVRAAWVPPSTMSLWIIHGQGVLNPAIGAGVDTCPGCRIEPGTLEHLYPEEGCDTCNP